MMLCEVTGCDRQVQARGWCFMHYQRWRRHGDVFFVDKPRGKPRYASEPGLKVCTHCMTEKTLDDFPLLKHGPQGRGSWCKACHAEHGRRKYREKVSA